MSFPNSKQIQKVLKKLEGVEPTLVIDFKNASRSELLKYELCQEFVKILKNDQVSQVELARKLDVDKAVVNKIIKHKINHFTSDRLIDLLSKLRDVDLSLKAS